MALLNSDENVQALIEAEVTPLAKSASSGAEIDTRSADLTKLLNEAPAIVLPPDTGYELKTADALYAGIAAVLGGQSTPGGRARRDRPEAGPLTPASSSDRRPAVAPRARGRPLAP